ncbi:MAG: TRAP transporter small permease subunit [Burkholderiales bacterium]|nr:MAG: TRAP transporter small permease subunit [Burkholderiales bacterium]
MNALIGASRAIDALNERVGRTALWLVLVAVLISAGNAVVRYTFSVSSNAWLEVQWYLFSAVFLLCAGYTLRHNQHVRIDILSSRLSARGQAWIEVVGTVLFLMPMCLLILVLSWAPFVEAWTRGEVSSNAGGLIVWPARLLMPVGFALLVLQGLSELIKRIAFLRGRAPDPVVRQTGPSAEALLAEEIRRRKEAEDA